MIINGSVMRKYFVGNLKKTLQQVGRVSIYVGTYL